MKLFDKLYVEELKYSEEVNPKHQKHMDRKDLGIFNDFQTNQFLSTPPPSNDSDETLREMLSIEQIPDDNPFAKKADNIKTYFKDFLAAKGLRFPNEEVSTLLHDSRPILYKIKYHYNRPRPIQVADALGLKFHEQPLASSKTPSYPSGHSAQGILIGKYLATVYPKYSTEIMKLADDISNSRLIAKVHFPSDSKFGLNVGLALFKHITNTAELKMDKLSEAITIPIEVGDTILGGKFKNKRIVVKDIGRNEKGDITINGRPLLKYRIIKDTGKSNGS